jgi:hypothetical protein
MCASAYVILCSLCMSHWACTKVRVCLFLGDVSLVVPSGLVWFLIGSGWLFLGCCCKKELLLVCLQATATSAVVVLSMSHFVASNAGHRILVRTGQGALDMLQHNTAWRLLCLLLSRCCLRMCGLLRRVSAGVGEQVVALACLYITNHHSSQWCPQPHLLSFCPA